MKLFKLPDLGEGLPDAVIREWYIKIGDEVKTDQPLVAMETAKALVDVPSPYDGKIEKLFGQPGDTIETGQPLIGFVGESTAEDSKDAGTVVGAIEEGKTVLKETAHGMSKAEATAEKRVKATPAIRQLAKEWGVDLTQITPSGETITAKDLKHALAQKDTWTPVEGVQRAMVNSMAESHRQVVPVTLVDDVRWRGLKKEKDITLRLIRAIQTACETVPSINAYFDSQKMALQRQNTVNLGIAVDTPHGLYVPVIKNITQQSDSDLRTTIDRFKQQAKERRIPQSDLHGATLILSNFGTLAGRYATPIIIPPMVAILGVGKWREEVVPEHGQPVICPVLPLSVTVDHRAVTGGEAARFLKILIDVLEKEA
ncbi:MAG: branched-chain alpha-keto acid dehydrogenase subunit E2 [Coxiella sp. RIFCSPHIGHO2_12_FULL_44_14]|nr:MAG: branched-chain alpha-keto acid dehydrogenase subunit E2 [Coxiella sp. RIFCSPHIGHO2_12_FULL_44_14]